MKKILEIECCSNCPEQFRDSLGYRHCGITRKQIKVDVRGIPSWCPLPDQPEPITPEKLLEMIMKCEEYQTHSGFSKLELKKLCELINNHFLGVKND